MMRQQKSAEKTAITPTRAENFPEWYQQVVKEADLAENSAARGCMTIKPWGYGIWENMQRLLDLRIKETGHSNAYFPLFIPLSFLEKEAEHVEGFAKECAVVTHHRLEERDGKLVPAGELEEPLIVRPTSETVIGHHFARWIHSYRDLPLLINQWANVVRWEMRTRIFLRTSEFLWQEGHTAHATEEEAIEETLKMLEVYREFMEKVLAIPVIVGQKSPGEKFPGAVTTYALEAMMQDGKALQMGTSHHLGQNFARSNQIRFSDPDGNLEYVHTTSWGVTTRMIGGVIMIHSDDNGLRLPPRIATKQIAILPILIKPEHNAQVMEAVKEVEQLLSQTMYADERLRVTIDSRDLRGGEKKWEWIKKGIPLRLEIGPRDIEEGVVSVYRRDRAQNACERIPKADLSEYVQKTLAEIQQNYYEEALSNRNARFEESITDFEELKQYFAEENEESGQRGFVRAKWCGDPESEKLLEALKVSIRVLPLDQSSKPGKCVLTGKPGTIDVLIARSY